MFSFLICSHPFFSEFRGPWVVKFLIVTNLCDTDLLLDPWLMGLILMIFIDLWFILTSSKRLVRHFTYRLIIVYIQTSLVHLLQALKIQDKTKREFHTVNAWLKQPKPLRWFRAPCFLGITYSPKGTDSRISLFQLE